jgi:hypothetical protein
MRALCLLLVSSALVHLCPGEITIVSEPLRVASFNIQTLGDAKVGKPEVVSTLIKVR